MIGRSQSIEGHAQRIVCALYFAICLVKVCVHIVLVYVLFIAEIVELSVNVFVVSL